MNYCKLLADYCRLTSATKKSWPQDKISGHFNSLIAIFTYRILIMTCYKLLADYRLTCNMQIIKLE